MSLYNMIHGENPLAVALLGVLGLTRDAVPRYRDCWWTDEMIAVHTRTGGGNRDYYESESRCRSNYPEYFTGPDDPSGPWNKDLRAIEGFEYDEDDGFDTTYATFYFKPSPVISKALAGLQAQDATPAQRWTAFFERLKTDPTDPQAQRVMTAMAPLLSQLTKLVGDARADSGQGD